VFVPYIEVASLAEIIILTRKTVKSSALDRDYLTIIAKISCIGGRISKVGILRIF
jgi:hypothetical protein